MNKKNIVRGGDKIPSPPIYISEHDLEDEDIKSCIELLGLEEVLFQIGFSKKPYYEDTESFYEIIECEHRSRMGKIVKGKRYTGLERIDSDWIENGLPSEEAKIAYRGDNSYVQEIRELSKRSLLGG